MNAIRRFLSTALILAALLTAGLLGYSALQNIQFAHAQRDVQAAREGLNSAQDLSTVFRNVGKVVEPSVVNIEVHKTIRGVRNQPFDDELLRRFFPQGQIPENMEPEQSEQIGTGSGVIMDVDGSTGYILTNNHVAGDAQEMDVTLSDGRVIKEAKLVGADPKSDLAVVKIQADHLIAAKWGDSSLLQKGDWIMAFGSPFGYVGSMTHGIVSALDRQAGILGAQGYEDFIQVDAPINPGNSGGPLVNLQAQVVGINTAIASRSGGFQGIGFAIPSNEAQYIYKALKEKGKVTRGWLGVGIADVATDLPLAKSFGFTDSVGVLVREIIPNTPAAGILQHGDIITELNGKPLEDHTQLRNAIAAIAPDTEVKLKVFRDKKYVDVTVKLGTQPEDLEAVAGHPGDNNPAAAPENGSADALGMRLSNLTSDIARQYSLNNVKHGAVVTEVKRDSTAFRLGLRPGDVILEVDQQSIDNAQQAGDALAKADLHKGVRLYVATRAGSQYLFLQEK